MGMYTEIFFRAEVDKEAYDVLKALYYSSRIWPVDHTVKFPEHEFFKSPRAMNLVNGSSWYFPQANHFEAEALHNGGFSYHVSFRSNFKNYDGEIAKFFDWVSPHCVGSEGFLGYFLYEEDLEPTFYIKGVTHAER